MGVKTDSPSSDRISRVFPENLVERVGEVKPPEMPIAGPAQVGRSDIMGSHIPDTGRTYQESIGVEMLPPRIITTGIVAVMMHAQLCSVAQPDKVLFVEIGDDHLTMTGSKDSIQHAVRVLLQEVEIRHIPLNAIRIEIPEESNARFVISEDEAPEIAGKPLNPGSSGHEVKASADVG